MFLFSALRRAPLAFALAALCTTTAHAVLGGNAAGVRTDSARMNTRLSTRAMGKYARHELTRGNGGIVHEFTNASGQVFAVSWSGPGKPDLRTLLGGYFPTVQASGSGRLQHSLRRPVRVSQPNLRISTGGHMGWFNGVAFIPSLAPAGFSASDLPVQP